MARRPERRRRRAAPVGWFAEPINCCSVGSAKAAVLPVAALENRRDGLLLDRCGFAVTSGLETPQQRSVEGETFKIHKGCTLSKKALTSGRKEQRLANGCQRAIIQSMSID